MNFKIIGVCIALSSLTGLFLLNANLINRVSQYEAQIKLLEAQSKAQAERYAAAEQTAKQSIKAINRRSRGISREPIATTCDAAISWANEKSRGFEQ